MPEASLLFLPPIPEELDVATLPVVYKSIAEIGKKSCEPAGKAYHEYCCRALGLGLSTDAEGPENRQRSESLEDDKKRRADWEKKHKDKVAAAIEAEPEENLYEVLGLGHLGFNASFKQIKKAYQKQILIHHPDKKKGGKSEAEEKGESDPKFLAIQKAWDILGNEKKRRGYDSTFDFDDTVPSGSEVLSNDDEFYELYAPVFERNGRFSEKKPVPHLGDDKTNIAKVRGFYQFWSRFESWREFSKYDEFKDGDIEDASCREEKRWMINQNERIRKKKKKKEYERISLLVERAQKRDPRLIRAREAEKERKRSAAKERLAAKLAAEKEAKEKLIAEERAKAEAERIVKEIKERERKQRQSKKKMLKKKTKLLMKQVETSCNSLNKEPAQRLKFLKMTDDLCHNITDIDELSEICKAFENIDISEEKVETGIAIAALEALENVHKYWKKGKADDSEKLQREHEEKIKLEKEELEKKKNALKGDEWSAEELSTLAKALKKFPGGTRKRWESVAEYVNLNCSQHEGKNRTKEQCVERVKEMGKEMQHKRETEVVSSSDAFKQTQRNVKTKTERKAGKVSESESLNNNNEAGGDAIAEVVWSEEEHGQLEAALKANPATMEKNERWRKISAAVQTKSKKECVARYKYIRAQILAKKKVAQT